LHFFRKQGGDDADIPLRPEAAERAGAAHGRFRHVGLHQRRIHKPVIDRAQIVERPPRRARRQDGARRAADHRGLAAPHARRMADDPGDGLADGEEGAAAGASGDLERDPPAGPLAHRRAAPVQRPQHQGGEGGKREKGGETLLHRF
jgi:hypothetical protein